MKRLIALAFATTLAAAASAADRREDRAVSGFNAIGASVNIDLEVIQDGTESLRLEGDEEVLARTETFVRDGTLHIQYKRDHGNSWRSPSRIHGVVHARDVNAIALASSGKVRSASLKADSLALSISGSGDMDIAQLAAREATLAISGSGNVSLVGRAEQLQARISGSGDIKAGRLEAERVQVRISGSGKATVWAKQQLATSIAGAGDVRYYGDPTLTKSISGSGRIERLAANP